MCWFPRVSEHTSTGTFFFLSVLKAWSTWGIKVSCSLQRLSNRNLAHLCPSGPRLASLCLYLSLNSSSVKDTVTRFRVHPNSLWSKLNLQSHLEATVDTDCGLPLWTHNFDATIGSTKSWFLKGDTDGLPQASNPGWPAVAPGHIAGICIMSWEYSSEIRHVA